MHVYMHKNEATPLKCTQKHSQLHLICHLEIFQQGCDNLVTTCKHGSYYVATTLLALDLKISWRED